MSSSYINVAAYKFVNLQELEQRKEQLLPLCQQLQLKGTILLSLEGINIFLSGTRENIDQFVAFLRAQPEFADIPVKESPSAHQPHSRLLIRLKKEIISMGMDEIKPLQKTSPKIEPDRLKAWLDEGREVVLLDVRNDYEIEVGTFENAVPIGVDSFRTFPDAVDTLPAEMKDKPIVMFCTGGIRCEKAGPLMEQKGFGEIYQLDGGILKYFEDCGGDHYEGDCFVFDKRVAVDPKLQETDADLCYACQAVLSAEDQQSEKYVPPLSCPHCYLTPEQQLRRDVENRNALVAELTSPLPGSVPYNNVRPINVPLRFDHQTVLDVLVGMHPQMSPQYWQDECRTGMIVWKGEPLSVDTKVRSGWRVEHLLPQTVEPDVNAAVEILYEDADLIGVNKPAPLPMHPCGRFNRNSLIYVLNKLYEGEQIRICHRLDANTTGTIICCRKKSAARNVIRQFEEGTVKKSYLAEVQGHPAEDEFISKAKIASEPSEHGARVIDENGLAAETQFKVLARRNETTLIQCQPITGRTNQIRVHLWDLGIPIVGDPLYLPSGKIGGAQTLRLTDPSMHLHAAKLELKHPVTYEEFVIESPQPDWAI